MGTKVALGVAAGAVAAGADELADGAADDVAALQAASASPTPTPSAQMPAVLAARVKCREVVTFLPYCPEGSGVTLNGERGCLTVFSTRSPCGFSIACQGLTTAQAEVPGGRTGAEGSVGRRPVATGA
jgi:hypothetical protein